MKKLKDDIRGSLNILTKSGVITPEQLVQVLEAVDGNISSWSSDVSALLRQMAVDWEGSMGDTDESFYSLGLRRAEDLILGVTINDRYPVLETKNTPNDFPAEKM